MINVNLMVLIGPSASGKSSYAFEKLRQNRRNGDTEYLELNRDLLRAEYQREFQNLLVSDRPDYSKWKFKNEKTINKMFLNRFIEYLDHFIYNDKHFGEKERTIIWSDTNLNQDRLESKISELINEARTKNVNLICSYKLFIENEEVLNKRDRQRESGVGESVIHKQLSLFHKELPKIFPKLSEEDKGRYPYLRNLNRFMEFKGHKILPTAVLIDIDGTVANMVDRGPFEWDKVLSDEPIKEHEDLIFSYIKNNNIENVIFLTGRDGKARKDTIEWLETKSFLVKELKKINKSYTLYNRAESDQRRDSIIKQEILLDKIAFNYDIKAVFDDRPQVCRMWWHLGLKCYQLQNPYIEF